MELHSFRQSLSQHQQNTIGASSFTQPLSTPSQNVLKIALKSPKTFHLTSHFLRSLRHYEAMVRMLDIVHSKNRTDKGSIHVMNAYIGDS